MQRGIGSPIGCWRCKKPLLAAGFYNIRGKLFCAECAEVMYRLLRTTVREEVGLIDDVEVLAWIMIYQSMLGGEDENAV